MPEYVALKLLSGQDIIGTIETVEPKSDGSIEVVNPVQVVVDPHQGLYAKSYLLFSEETSCVFAERDIVHMSKASKKACNYYDDFIHRIAQGYQTEDADYSMTDDESESIEDMFEALMEAKSSIKH